MDSSILVGFNIVNMFASIDSISGLGAVSDILGNRESDFPPAECILEVLTISLTHINSVFDNVFTYRRMVQSWALTCHGLILTAMCRFDIKALNYWPGVQYGKRFRDDIFCLWNHSLKELQKNFGFENNVHTTGKIKFTKSVANESVLEFLDWVCI